jgi:CubicO group peptidase (beta-lactamase class C family)
MAYDLPTRRLSLIAVSLLLGVLGHAQETREDPAMVAFLEGIVPSQLAEYRIPGAAAVVVRDGAVAAARGWGVADTETGTPVDPGRTLFRIASVTKLLTWTAVMQLEERGLVDLDADVNTFLRAVRVPAAFGAPVTLRHLMTHTAGFEDVGIGTLRYEPPGAGSLAGYLARHLPARVRPPGSVVMYSNHGAALAGLVVEEVAGIPFEDYVEQHILVPLGMTRTSVRQPPPEPLRASLSHGHVLVNGALRPTTYAIDLLAPAGGASAAAGDMAAFMLAHLEGGVAHGSRILEARTVELMHRTAFTYDPAVPGWALGFQELHHGGRRIIFHDGSFQGNVSLLALVPELRLGFFVVYNSSGGAEAVDEILTAFLDTFVPPAPVAAASPGDAGRSTGPVPHGLYVPARRPYTTIEKLNRPTRVSRATEGPGGTLEFLGRSWQAVREGLYADTTSDDVLKVLEDGRGRVTGVAVGSFTFDRLRFWQHPALHAAAALLALGIMLSCLAAWPIRAAQRRAAATPAGSALGRAARWVAGTGAALAVAAIAGILLVLSTSALAASVPRSLFVLSLVPPVVGVAAVAALLLAAACWARREGSVGGRVYLTLVATSLAVMTLLMRAYGIFGPHLG